MQTSKKKRTIVPWNQHTKSNASLEGANKPAKNTIGSAKDIWHVGGEREFGVEGDAEVPNFAHLFKLMLGPTQLPNAKVVPLLSYSATLQHTTHQLSDRDDQLSSTDKILLTLSWLQSGRRASVREMLMCIGNFNLVWKFCVLYKCYRTIWMLDACVNLIFLFSELWAQHQITVWLDQYKHF